ncbi:arginine repressor [Microbacteriaceae bacterium 4G12]
MKKQLRHQFIKELLKKHDIQTQEQLVDLLQQNGIHATQATVSRDIHELGLIKVQSDSGISKYAVMLPPTRVNERMLKHQLSDALVDIHCVSTFVLLKLLPGNAHVIGALLDEVEWEEKIGTLCGNDTCLVFSRSEEGAQLLYKRIQLFLS